MIIPVGKSSMMKTWKFSFNQIPHVKVAGCTGSGKTKFMEYLCYFMCAHERPERLSIVIIDLKGGASFAHFERMPHVLGIYADIEESEAVLDMIHDEMIKRLKRIRECRSAFATLPTFPRVVVIIDEGGELAPALGVDKEDVEQRKRIFKHISSLARIGREPRISIVFGTQRPSDETLPVSIRGQLEGTFCFRTENELDSGIVLRHPGAEKLPRIPGRCIYKSPAIGEVTMQSFYVEDEVLQRFIEGYPRGDKLERSNGEISSTSIQEFTEFVES